MVTKKELLDKYTRLLSLSVEYNNAQANFELDLETYIENEYSSAVDGFSDSYLDTQLAGSNKKPTMKDIDLIIAETVSLNSGSGLH